jgi:hypothetical protein
VIRPAVLVRMLQAQDHRARAYAARVVGRWHDRLQDPLGLLAERVVDEHPQVRMEAVMADRSGCPRGRSAAGWLD